MPPRLKFGLNATNQFTTWDEYRRLCLEAEAMGFDSFWVFDHFIPGPSDAEGSALECFTTVSALAALTNRITLGTLVLSVTYRNPAVVAKMAGMVDVLSGGRFVLGLGAGWYQLEHRIYGIDFPPNPVRVTMLDEACRVIKTMWGPPGGSFRGRYFRCEDTRFDPAPIQRPHPPILIGGRGDRMLRLTARHADMFNDGSGDLERIHHAREIIDAAARGYGRDPVSIEHTAIVLHSFGTTPAVVEAKQRRLEEIFRRPFDQLAPRTLSGSPEEVGERLEAYVAAGISHVMISCMAPYDLDALGLMADKVMPQFR